jgi:RND family efflux transporter MFP subunit
MRKIFFLIIPVQLMFSCGEGRKEAKSETAASDTIPVRIEPVSAFGDTSRIRISGLLHTEDELRLSFKIGGVIAAVSVEEGQRVRKGQLLASLNATEIDAQLQLASIQLEKAQRDNQRAENLYRDSVATLEQVQNSRTAVAAAKEALKQVTFNRQHASIVAPTDGFVIKRMSNSGEMISPGMPVVVIGALGGGSKWVLKAGVSDREWSAIQPGDRTAVTFDAFPGRSFPGVVATKALAADPANGTFMVDLRVDLGSEKPATGMFGRAEVIPSVVREGYSIPYESLLEADGDKGHVFVTDDRKTVRMVEVTIASLTQQRVYIRSGLEGHPYVVTAGSPYLKDGSPIRVRD